MKIKRYEIAQSFIMEPIVVKTEDYTYNIIEKYMCEIINSWDNYCLDKLYEEYKKLRITKLLVINREEFKRFLIWAIPLYYEKMKGEN